MTIFEKVNQILKTMDKVKVYQANAITEGRYNFDVIEKRIVYFICAEVRKKFIETSEGQRDIFNDLVINLKGEQLRKADSNMKRVYEAVSALRKKDIEINTADVWLNVGFINYGKHLKKADEVEIGVSKEILPYLIDLTGSFTSYQLSVAITLKSKYTQRFYELASMWKNKGYFFMKVENLRRMLKAEDSFKTFGEFKRGVLDVAKKELQTAFDEGVCDLYFDFGVLEKKVKKVVTLEFYIKTAESKEKPEYTMADFQNYIRTTINALYPNDQEFIKRIMTAYATDYALTEKLAEKLLKKKTEYSNKELPAIVRYILKEDFQII